MKGILKKTETGWFVVFDQRTMQDPSAEDMVLPLEPKMANYLDMNLTSTTYQKEKEFEEIDLVDRINQSGIYIFKKYAKIVETDENGKPLTYWGGVEKPKQEFHTCKYCKVETTQPDDECYARPKQESYICPHTNVQCDDECCVSAENCNIDNDELEYPISDDCEAVKNWDSFVEQKNLELLAEKHYPMCEWAEEQCVVRRLAFINGYNRAKETLYTEEQMELCWIAAMSNRAGFSDLISYKEFIQSLKKDKL